MSFLNVVPGGLQFAPSPVEFTRPDLLTPQLPQLTGQPSYAARSLIQLYPNLGYQMPSTVYLGFVGPGGSPIRTVPQGPAGFVQASAKVNNAAGWANRLSAERLRELLLSVRLASRAFPSVGGA